MKHCMNYQTVRALIQQLGWETNLLTLFSTAVMQCCLVVSDTTDHWHTSTPADPHWTYTRQSRTIIHIMVCSCWNCWNVNSMTASTISCSLHKLLIEIHNIQHSPVPLHFLWHVFVNYGTYSMNLFSVKVALRLWKSWDCTFQQLHISGLLCGSSFLVVINV